MGLYIGWNQGGRVRTLRELLVRRPMRANIGKIELRKSCFHFGILGMSSRGPPRVSARVDNQFRFGIAGSCMIFNGSPTWARSEEHTSELQSLMRISYAVFCLKKKNRHNR